MKKSPISNSFSLLFIFLIFAMNAYSQAIKTSTQFSKEIQLGETHNYEISLIKGQFAVLTINQKGIDLAVKTYAPNGQLLEEFDSPNGTQGPELILLDAKETGIYKLSISPLGASKKVKSGSYELKDVAISDNPKIHLQAILSILNNRAAIPGFALSIVNQDRIVYKNAFGLANLVNKKPYTTQTIHNVGSTSKTMIGLALMLLVEQGKLTLDTPINDILPFEVVNPYYPNIPITIRHLANHTSSIKETKTYKKSYILTEKTKWETSDFQKSDANDFAYFEKNREMPMSHFLKNLLTKKGQWYKKKNFHKIKPGQAHHYSNAGATLAAYIVEIIAKESFADFTRHKIIQPLELKNTDWFVEKINSSKMATRYGVKDVALPNYKLITYPDGGLLTNVDDLSQYLMEFIKGQNGKSPILSANSFTEMMVNSSGNKGQQGYGIFLEIGRSGRIGHSGSDPGIVSMIFFDPATNIGTVLMANRSPRSMNARLAFSSIWKNLARYAPYFVENEDALTQH